MFFPHVQGPAPTPACLPCNEVEFYDEDEDVSGYEDNIYVFDNFDCETFKDSWLKIAKLMQGVAFCMIFTSSHPTQSDVSNDLQPPQKERGAMY